MPTYEYECSECGYRFEELQSFSEEPLSECPKCGARVQRLISQGAGLIFKGSGFYITDYVKKNNSGAPASENKKSSTEKSEAKTESKKQNSSSKKSSDAGD